MEITRIKGYKTYYDYEFTEENKKFIIAFGGNLDLYWTLKTNQNYKSYEEMSQEIYDTFTITKENYAIYSLFKTLIDDINNANVYTPSNEFRIVDAEKLEAVPPSLKQIQSVKERNEELKQREGYKRIHEGASLSWHSDEEPYAIADVLKISEEDDAIILEFYRPELTGDKYGMRLPGTVTIRFRNSGSYYQPFNMVFMRMYNQLQEFDPELDKEFHQLHIEELSYIRKKR